MGTRKDSCASGLIKTYNLLHPLLKLSADTLAQILVYGNIPWIIVILSSYFDGRLYLQCQEGITLTGQDIIQQLIKPFFLSHTEYIGPERQRYDNALIGSQMYIFMHSSFKKWFSLYFDNVFEFVDRCFRRSRISHFQIHIGFKG